MRPRIQRILPLGGCAIFVLCVLSSHAERPWLLEVAKGSIDDSLATPAETVPPSDAASFDAVSSWLQRHDIRNFENHFAPRNPNRLMDDREWLAVRPAIENAQFARILRRIIATPGERQVRPQAYWALASLKYDVDTPRIIAAATDWTDECTQGTAVYLLGSKSDAMAAMVLMTLAVAEGPGNLPKMALRSLASMGGASQMVASNTDDNGILVGDAVTIVPGNVRTIIRCGLQSMLSDSRQSQEQREHIVQTLDAWGK